MLETNCFHGRNKLFPLEKLTVSIIETLWKLYHIDRKIVV